MRFNHERLKTFMKFVTQIFAKEKDTETIAEVFIRADIIGLASYRIFRVPGLLEGIRLGIQHLTAKPRARTTHTETRLLPGELEYDREDRNAEVEISLYAQLTKIAEEYGVEL